ncbi:hypothetical protein [Bacillus fungorum]
MKPVGHNLKSPRELNAKLSEVFCETDIYCINC